MSYASLIVKNGIRACPFINAGMYKTADPKMFQSSQLISCIEGLCQGEIVSQPVLYLVFLLKKMCIFGLDGGSSRHHTEHRVPQHSPAASSGHQPLALSLLSILRAGMCAECGISYFLLTELPGACSDSFFSFPA